MAGSKKNLVLIVLAFIIFLSLFLFRVKDEMIDFEVNYRAGQRIWLGETLYRTEDGHYQFKYSPFSSLLYLPLTFLPLSVAKGIWYFLILFSYGFIFYLSGRLLAIKNKFYLYVLITFLILSKFMLREIQLGQINAVITMIAMIMVWWLVSKERSFLLPNKNWAGLAAGVATALKPYALIFFPYFFIKKQWKALFYGIILVVVSLLIPSAFYGFKGNFRVLQEWISSLSKSSPHLFNVQDNVSFIGFFLKWTGNEKISFIFYLAALISLAIFMLVVAKKGNRLGQPEILDCSLLLIFIPLISPLGWEYNFLMALPGTMIILVNFNHYPKSAKVLLFLNFFIITFSFYDLLGKELYERFMFLSIPTLNFLIIIVYLAYLRFKNIA